MRRSATIGSGIAFNREGPNERFGVWLMPAIGSADTELTSGRFDPSRIGSPSS